MDSRIARVISLLDMHVGLTDIQSKQLLKMAARSEFSEADRAMLKAMGDIDADTAAALRNSIEMLRKLK